MNLFDIMRQAGGGDAFSTLGSQYGFSEEQMRKAVEAFMPAFSFGLKRSTADPLGLMEFMQKLAQAQADFLRAYQNPAWAATGARSQGEDALAFLFGSPHVALALAKQASAMTGLAQEKLAELMPALAAMMFGGLAKQAAALNPIFDATLKQFQAGAAAPAGEGPLDRQEKEQATREQAGGADFLRAQNEMMQAGLAAFQAGSAAWQRALAEGMKAGGQGKSGPGAEASGRALFGEMFEPGLKLGEAYQREMEALLDRMRPASKGGDTRRS